MEGSDVRFLSKIRCIRTGVWVELCITMGELFCILASIFIYLVLLFTLFSRSSFIPLCVSIYTKSVYPKQKRKKKKAKTKEGYREKRAMDMEDIFRGKQKGRET